MQTATGLCIFQINVAKCGPAHDAALVLASQSGVDLILIQEPWVFTNISQKKTKTQPSYLAFAPLADWTSRPRAMTYTRKGCGLSPFQASIHSRNLLRVCVQRKAKPMIDCWNIYNAPIGSLDTGEGLRLLLTLSETPEILAKDFNIHHSAWDTTTRNDTAAREALLAWTLVKGLLLLKPYGVPTHDAGGVIDLLFAQTGPNFKCQVRPDLEVGSDHRTLLTKLPDKGAEASDHGRLRYKACAWDNFRTILSNRLILSPQTDPEGKATFLVEKISGALRAACPRSREETRGCRWWTEECEKAHRDFCRARRLNNDAIQERRLFGKVVRKAMSEYWRQKIDGFANLTEAYKITSWHKKQTRPHTPPMTEPDGPAVTPVEKAKLFRDTLLSRHLNQ